MSQVRSADDNATIESFFSLLQRNVLDRRAATHEELRIAIVIRIERTYHCLRRQARLGRLTPTEFAITMSQAAPTAA